MLKDRKRPPGSNWGEFGPDDQRGRMNYVTREKVLQGVAEVKEGLTFCCRCRSTTRAATCSTRGAIRRASPPRTATASRTSATPCRRTTRCRPTSSATTWCCSRCSTRRSGIRSRTSAACSTPTATATPEPVFYNGFRAGVDVIPAKENSNAESWARFEGSRAEALGIQNLAEHGAQGRGVMIDLHAHFGRKRQAVGYDDLMKNH